MSENNQSKNKPEKDPCARVEREREELTGVELVEPDELAETTNGDCSRRRERERREMQNGRGRRKIWYATVHGNWWWCAADEATGRRGKA